MKRFKRKPKPRSLRRTRFWHYFGIIIPALSVAAPAVGMLLITPSLQANAVEDFKEVILAVSTGILTLTAAFVGASLQNLREREKELRDLRRQRSRWYRDYILELMRIGKQLELRGQLDGSRYKSTLETKVEEMIRTLPPTEEFSAIDDQICRQAVDEAINAGLNYWIYPEGHEGRPGLSELQHIYRTALTQLDFYESDL